MFHHCYVLNCNTLAIRQNPLLWGGGDKVTELDKSKGEMKNYKFNIKIKLEY